MYILQIWWFYFLYIGQHGIDSQFWRSFPMSHKAWISELNYFLYFFVFYTVLFCPIKILHFNLLQHVDCNWDNPPHIWLSDSQFFRYLFVILGKTLTLKTQVWFQMKMLYDVFQMITILCLSHPRFPISHRINGGRGPGVLLPLVGRIEFRAFLNSVLLEDHLIASINQITKGKGPNPNPFLSPKVNPDERRHMFFLWAHRVFWLFLEVLDLFSRRYFSAHFSVLVHYEHADPVLAGYIFVWTVYFEESVGGLLIGHGLEKGTETYLAHLESSRSMSEWGIGRESLLADPRWLRGCGQWQTLRNSLATLQDFSDSMLAAARNALPTAPGASVPFASLLPLYRPIVVLPPCTPQPTQPQPVFHLHTSFPCVFWWCSFITTHPLPPITSAPPPPHNFQP